MKSQLLLITLACSLSLVGCSSSQAQPNAESPSIGSNTSTLIAEAPSPEPGNMVQNISKSSVDSASGYQCPGNNDHLFIGNSTAKNKYGNPIYPMYLCAGGKEIRSYAIVTGRNFTQQRNRNQSGTQSPLPNGKYRVGTTLTPGLLAEVGKVEGLGVRQPFLPYIPLVGSQKNN